MKTRGTRRNSNGTLDAAWLTRLAVIAVGALVVASACVAPLAGAAAPVLTGGIQDPGSGRSAV